MKTILAIALGGACGSVARHIVNTGLSTLLRAPFPWGTLVVNVTGSFVIGLLVALFAAIGNPSQDMRLFLITGFLGGYTTFSAFSLDAMNLWTKGDMAGMVTYVAASVVLSLAAVFAGSYLGWKFAA